MQILPVEKDEPLYRYPRHPGQGTDARRHQPVFAEEEARAPLHGLLHEREIVGKGYTGVGGSPEEFAAFNRADFAYKGRLIKLSGAKAE